MRGFFKAANGGFQGQAQEAALRRRAVMAQLAWYQATLKEFEFCRLLRVPSSTPTRSLYEGKVVKL